MVYTAFGLGLEGSQFSRTFSRSDERMPSSSTFTVTKLQLKAPKMGVAPLQENGDQNIPKFRRMSDRLTHKSALPQ
jgi:hypothetical protein